MSRKTVSYLLSEVFLKCLQSVKKDTCPGWCFQTGSRDVEFGILVGTSDPRDSQSETVHSSVALLGMTVTQAGGVWG